MTSDLPTEGSSSEQRGRVHALRTVGVVLPLMALILVSGVAAAGSLRTSPDLGPTPIQPTSDSVVLESTANPPAVTQPEAPSERPAVAVETEAEAVVEIEAAPPSAARLVTGPVERIIDTRTSTVDRAGAEILTIDLPTPGSSVTGLVLSVSLLDATQAGTVTIEAPAGTIDVLTVGGADATTTNGFVVVPGTATSQLVNPTGGDLVVDLVGRFVTSGPSGAGRLLSTEPLRLGQLVTATDGREAEISLVPSADGGDIARPEAALVLITADVGDDGGRVTLGPSSEQPDQMLMWGPPTGPNRQRSGVALVTPGPDGRFALRYDGGSALDVDLVGYVTGDGATSTIEGLFIPATQIAAVDRRIAQGTTLLGPVPPASAAVIVGLRAAPGGGIVPQPAELARDLTVASGRTIGTLLPIGTGPDGRRGILVTAAAELDARIQPLGYLLAPGP